MNAIPVLAILVLFLGFIACVGGAAFYGMAFLLPWSFVCLLGALLSAVAMIVQP